MFLSTFVFFFSYSILLRFFLILCSYIFIWVCDEHNDSQWWSSEQTRRAIGLIAFYCGILKHFSCCCCNFMDFKPERGIKCIMLLAIYCKFYSRISKDRGINIPKRIYHFQFQDIFRLKFINYVRVVVRSKWNSDNTYVIKIDKNTNSLLLRKLNELMWCITCDKQIKSFFFHYHWHASELRITSCMN